MRHPLNRGSQLGSIEPIWSPESSHYGGGARIEPLWRGSPPHTWAKLLMSHSEKGRRFHLLTVLLQLQCPLCFTNTVVLHYVLLQLQCLLCVVTNTVLLHYVLLQLQCSLCVIICKYFILK